LTLSRDQMERYSRQLILREIGGRGQARLTAARVLIVGAGGLGSPVAFYLAAAGVGTIGIIDYDTVSLSNLQRQILHTTAEIGKPKVISAREKLTALNPDCHVVTYQERLSADNVMDLVAGYDLVVDGTDNFPTRFLLNDACVLANKPFFHGGVLQFYGEVLTVIPGKGPCFRCLFLEPPPEGAVPTCQEAGILGAVAGMIGVIQACEVVKYILGAGDLLVGRLLTVDALTMVFQETRVERNRDCPVCGDAPVILKPEEVKLPPCQSG